MEIARPHIVVWTGRPGLGTDLIAALSAHPVEVSEVRGLMDARRVAAGRPPMLVVVVSPSDIPARLAEAANQFPGVPILLFSDIPESSASGASPAGIRIEEIPARLPLQELCWHVTEALSRTPRRPETPERCLGPIAIEIDRLGIVGATHDMRGNWFFAGPSPRPGESILPLLQLEDRRLFTEYLERAENGPLSFFPLRILDSSGGAHPMHAGLRGTAAGGILLILQPLIDAAPIVGRRRGTRDPLTGLVDRWELWRRMEQEGAAGAPAFVLFARLNSFEAIAETMAFQRVDEVFDRVASAIAQVFPWPAEPSRLTGGAFLLLVKEESAPRMKARAGRLIEMVNHISGGGVSAAPRFSLSIGIARVIDGDHDLAVRLAEAAAREARAAGGNRTIVVGPDTFIESRIGELAANLEQQSWEVWLQPVVSAAGTLPEFYEALARFGTGTHPRVSRPDFFTTGRAAGLLERFDRMMVLRSVELLTAHPQLRLSVNASRETFSLDSFPQGFLCLLREAGIGTDRVLLEISPVCLTMTAEMVRPRLERLAAAGIGVALDDFGSGVCSLRHLTDYPLAMVKLDEIVTGYVADDPLQRTFVRMVVNLCRARGIRTVAEYTRTTTQLERLAEDGVELFQGELFGLPRPAAEFLAPRTIPPSRP